jgi:hypothetical protein
LSNEVKKVKRSIIIGYSKVDKGYKGEKNIFNNITSVLKDFGKYRKEDVCVAHRAIQTTVVSSSNIKYRLTRHMEKMMGTSRKTLQKHRKFRLQINVNDELAYWTVISRQPYKDRLA